MRVVALPVALGFLASLLVACGASDDAPFAPNEGPWTTTEATLTGTTCGLLGDLGLVDGSFGEGQEAELTLGEVDGSFTWAPVDGGAGPDTPPRLECDLLANRHDFVCEPLRESFAFDAADLAAGLPEDSPLRDLIDGLPAAASVTFAIEVEVDGTFPTATTADTTTTLTLECQGLLCAGLGALGVSLPCTLTTDARLEWTDGG